MSETNYEQTYNKYCNYCGCFHNYSPERCRDMTKQQVGKIDINPLNKIDEFIFCPHCGKRIK